LVFANKNIGDKIITFTRVTRGVSHCGLAICIKKVSLKAKEELWKLKYLFYLVPRGQNPLSYYILYNEYKHNILASVVGQ